MSGSIGCGLPEVACAAQEIVLRTGATREEQGAIDGLSRPVQAYRDVIHAQPEGCCHLLAGFVEQIHASQDVSILGFERRQQFGETGACQYSLARSPPGPRPAAGHRRFPDDGVSLHDGHGPPAQY